MRDTPKKRLLITGVSGLLGSNVAYCLKDKYDIMGLYHAHEVALKGIRTERVDLTCEGEVKKILEEFKPDVVMHGAAISDVDFCEDHEGLAEQVNVLGTRLIVSQIAARKIKLIYISTDLVYDDVSSSPVTEDTPINPPNCYARTKYKAEQEALKKEGALILRTNIFGWNIQDKLSLAEWVVHELSKGRKIQGFKDVYFSSIYTFALANILDKAMEMDLEGIYNCGSSTFMSKDEFLHKVAYYFHLDESLIEMISIDQSPLRATRRKNLGLDVSKMETVLGFRFPSLEESIKRFFEDYQRGIPAQIKDGIRSGNVYPVLDHIPYGRQSIMEDDIQAVVEVLKSGYLTQGPQIGEFENALAKMTGAAFTVAVNSGTSALHIACLAAGVGPGDEVITSSNTFVASANCIVYCGGKPVFADIDPKTYNISCDEIERKITKRTKAVIPVHFAGQSCDMERIREIVQCAERKWGHKIYILEDACHALGSIYKKINVGSCAYSDMAVMSFHPVKHITTGEGGAVLVNDKALWRRLRYLRSHGITSEFEEFICKENASESSVSNAERVRRQWYYEQQHLGFNYRITDIQCALGCSQLKKLNEFRRQRRKIVNTYNHTFRGIPHLTIPFEEDFCDSNFHLYVLLFDFAKIGINRSQLIFELRKQGIFTQVHYIPVHTQPFFRNTFGTRWGDCSNAEAYYQKCLSIPLYPTMTEVDIKNVISAVGEAVIGHRAVSPATRI